MKTENFKIAVLSPDKWFLTSFDETHRSRLIELGWSGKLMGNNLTKQDVVEHIAGCQIAITSWDSLGFDDDILNAAPSLGLICHAAGTVKGIVCEQLWQRGIRVTSAAPAIAKGVGEHSLGLMLSAMKNCYAFNEAMKKNIDTANMRSRIVETFGITVGVVGCGLTGRRFIELLSMFDLGRILVHDPYLDTSEANDLGVEKTGLETLMKKSDVVALHAPRLDETRNLINRNNLKLLKDNAIIINTASGWLIDEESLIDELKKRPIIAALDVTYPEPPLPDSELRKLPNVILTPHIAGVASNNRYRIGLSVLNEIENYISGKSQINPVYQEQLIRTA